MIVVIVVVMMPAAGRAVFVLVPMAVVRMSMPA